MIQKKSTKGDLENRKGTFLILGIVLVLGLIYVGFELYATRDVSVVVVMDDANFEAIDEDVVSTDQQAPPPPVETQQQQEEVILKAVEDNVAVTTDWNFNSEFDEDLVISDYKPIETVEEAVDATPPARFAEEMPEYPGGMEAMYLYLAREIQYPEVARQNNIQGVVMVEFVVERDGSISNVKVISSLYPDCDKEATAKIGKMPKWKAGKTMGKPIRCFYQLPVRFSLGG